MFIVLDSGFYMSVMFAFLVALCCAPEFENRIKHLAFTSSQCHSGTAVAGG